MLEPTPVPAELNAAAERCALGALTGVLTGPAFDVENYMARELLDLPDADRPRFAVLSFWAAINMHAAVAVSLHHAGALDLDAHLRTLATLFNRPTE